MTPQQLLKAVSGAMLRQPPAGLTRKYVRGFLARNESALLAAIQRGSRPRPERSGEHWAKGSVPLQEVLQEVQRSGISAIGMEERLEETDPDLHLDPVISELVQNGGLRADLIVEIAEELRPKARAIPGFLRRDGKDWLTLARLHYNEPGVMVVEVLPEDAWKSDNHYETPNSYAELVNFALDYSYPDVRDEHYEDDELVERLCSCQRNPGGRR